MPSNQTPNYQLSQWVRSDKVRMEDFNTDNAKIDAALKAEADARTAADASLSRTVAGKADASALDSLSGTVAGHTSVLGHKGDCQFYTTSYTGNDQYGKDYSTTLSFYKRPMVVFIFNGVEYMILFQGSTSGAVVIASGTRNTCTVSWSGNSVSWYSSDHWSQMNQSKTYRVIALLEA